VEFSKKVRDHQAAESPMVEVEICDDETEEVQQHEQQMQLEKRLPLGDALAGITSVVIILKQEFQRFKP
jgi:hypothetical protein